MGFEYSGKCVFEFCWFSALLAALQSKLWVWWFHVWFLSAAGYWCWRILKFMLRYECETSSKFYGCIGLTQVFLLVQTLDIAFISGQMDSDLEV